MCKWITELSLARRFQEGLTKYRRNTEYASSYKESISVLLQTHFPGSRLVDEEDLQTAQLVPS